MLSSSAFNALLKTLEEPPPYGVFILATTELRKLPKTVLSRCQRFDFKQLRDAGMVERMREILTDLERDADAEALEAIARAAQGGMRDALTLLEKCCALGDGKLTLQTVAQMLNLADEQTVRALADAITGYQERRALQTLCELVDAGIEPSAIVAQLIAHMQGSLRRCVLGEEDALPPAVTRRMLLHCLDVLLEAENSMKTSARADIVLEAAVMRLLLPEAEASDADAVQLRLEKLEQKLAQACAQGVSTPQPAVQPTSPPRQAKKAPVAPVDSKLWEAVKAHFKKADNSIYVCIAGLNPAVVEEGVLHLTCETPGRLRLFDQMSCKVDVERVASELAGRRVKLECDCSEEGYDLPELDQDIEQID